MVRLHILLLSLLPLLQSAHPPVSVGRWERFESCIPNERRYDDPYRDVTLEATYTTPAGDQIRFWGFYDGGQTWKIRFMPHLTGTWRYEARFSDGSPASSGSFRVVDSDLPGMLQVNRSNPVWFAAGTDPFLMRGLHVGDRFFAQNWPREKRRAFLDWFQKQDYNTLSIASHYLNRDTEGRGRGWKTPALWPLEAAEFRKLETILDELARRHIVVYPFAGFFGRDSNYPREPGEQELYLRYSLARISPYWNVLFNVAGPEPNVGKGWMEPQEVEHLGRLVRRLDVFGHPLSVHNRVGDDPYRDADWTTYGTLQGPKTTDRQELSRTLLSNHHPGKPLLAQETLWSGNQYHIRRTGEGYSDDDIRKNAYVIHMSAAALIFGDMQGDSSSGFSGTMDLAARNQRRHDILRKVWDFFESTAYDQMTPRQDLVTSGYCLADPGREYLVYLESGSELDAAVENGPYAVRWINAQDTSDRRDAGTTRDGKGLRSPVGGDDWLLHLVPTGSASKGPRSPMSPKTKGAFF
ncbi:MAG: DUF5060 domain-containing protein [Acidobacteriota bacterium]